ncbi:MAG TPA: hypothetical protein VGB06_06825 [Solirubrobacterales bacterium]
MRQSWTDDRLDAFRGETQRRFDEVDRRFAEVDKRFDRVEDQIKELRGEMNARFESMEERFDARFDALQRMMLWFCGTMIVTLFGVVLTQGWFMITQL